MGAMAPFTSADDRRHPPGPELLWSESWSFDFVDRDGGLGGWVRLTLLPNLGVAWYDGYLCGPGRPLLAVIDREVPLPTSPPSLEIRTTGLWADHICETPMEHWTLGLEAFALGVDDPAEIYGRQFGDRVPLGFDLEWEADGPAVAAVGAATGFDQPCRVSGEILIGADAVDFDGIGQRDHRRGVRRDWDEVWFRVHGRLDDGTRFTATVGADGSAATINGLAAEVRTHESVLGGHDLPTSASVTLAADDGTELRIAVDPVAVTPVSLLDPEARVARAPRALCWFQTNDSRGGVGWAEWNQPT